MPVQPQGVGSFGKSVTCCFCVLGVGEEANWWHWAQRKGCGNWSIFGRGGQGVPLSRRKTHGEKHCHVHEAWDHLCLSHLRHPPLHEHLQPRWGSKNCYNWPHAHIRNSASQEMEPEGCNHRSLTASYARNKCFVLLLLCFSPTVSHYRSIWHIT